MGAALNRSIVSAVKGGMTAAQAAEHFGKSRAAIYAILRRAGVKKSDLRDDRKELAREMVKAMPLSPDMSVEEIAQQMNIEEWEVEELLSSALDKIRKMVMSDEKLRDEWTLALWLWDEDDKWARV